MEVPEQLQAEVAGGSQVLAPQQGHGLSHVRPAGEERAGTGKVQNISKSSSATAVWGTTVSGYTVIV